MLLLDRSLSFDKIDVIWHYRFSHGRNSGYLTVVLAVVFTRCLQLGVGSVPMVIFQWIVLLTAITLHIIGILCFILINFRPRLFSMTSNLWMTNLSLLLLLPTPLWVFSIPLFPVIFWAFISGILVGGSLLVIGLGQGLLDIPNKVVNFWGVYRHVNLLTPVTRVILWHIDGFQKFIFCRSVR